MRVSEKSPKSTFCKN